MKEIILLGSTGSIGTQTLDVCRRHNIKIKALSAHRNTKLLEEQAREFTAKNVCIGDEALYTDLKNRLSDTDINVSCGVEGMCELAYLSCDMVVNSVVGMVGLRPTLAAIEAKNTLALANKETLVVGGSLVIDYAKSQGVNIIPIDSEHSAIFQCLLGANGNKPKKIILTASGGPFYGYTKEMLGNVTKAEALNHPNWAMGQKITIDSATLMNKGLELIEAVWLFGLKAEDVDVVVHRQSIIHSAVEFVDGSIIAQMGAADMRTPIQFALTYPKRYECPSKKLSLSDIGTLTFGKADENTFVCLSAAKKAITIGGNAPCIINSANEAVVELFLKGKIRFEQIGELVNLALQSVKINNEITLSVILDTENAAREYVYSAVK